jgi:hypothetical protein
VGRVFSVDFFFAIYDFRDLTVRSLCQGVETAPDAERKTPACLETGRGRDTAVSSQASCHRFVTISNFGVVRLVVVVILVF